MCSRWAKGHLPAYQAISDKYCVIPIRSKNGYHPTIPTTELWTWRLSDLARHGLRVRVRIGIKSSILEPFRERAHVEPQVQEASDTSGISSDHPVVLRFPWGHEALDESLSRRAVQLLAKIVTQLRELEDPGQRVQRARASLQLAKCLGIYPWSYRPLARNEYQYHMKFHPPT